MVEEVQNSPAIQSAITELRGTFPNDAALKDAIGRLEMIGFDRAELSVVHSDLPGRYRTPEAESAPPIEADDESQARRLAASTAGAVAALAAAGVTVATGGAAAVAAAAAAAAGIVTGGVAAKVNDSGIKEEQAIREADARAGHLILSARLDDRPGKREQGEEAMRVAGATHVEVVARANAETG